MSELNLSLRPKKVEVSIEYCVPCDYSEQALRVAEELIQDEQHHLKRLVLVMGSKGVFEVKADDEVIFSKQALQRYPQAGEITARFREFFEASKEREVRPVQEKGVAAQAKD
ncbi:MAG TPA: Rdx family protein [Candidatus Binatia bacterium]|nr:Rdx family protein [Candidatus Binatia bacterium]